MRKIGALVRQIREQRGWSQTQMAAALDVAKSTISLYEHNKRSPSKRAVQTFHRLFNLADDEGKALLRKWLNL